MSEGETQPITLEQAIKQLEEGDLNVIDVILAAHLEEKEDNKYLKLLATNLVNHIKPVEWNKYRSNLSLFAQASVEDYDTIKILGNLFERSDLLEFTKMFFEETCKIFTSYPERIINILLFISSRAVQNSNQFYSWAVPALFSAISTNLVIVNFVDLEPYFEKFIDFEPEATTAPLQSVLTTQFNHLLDNLEKRNINNSCNYANYSFLNLMKFLQPLAFRFENFKTAYLILATRSIREDQSLTINPFRVKILQILMDAEHYLECVAPLAKIFSKSLQEKKNNEGTFDWDQLIVADKSTARNEGYQELLFAKSFEMLKLCLQKLKNRITFPEIIAPVVRTIKNMIESPIYKQKEQVLRNYLKELDKNSKRVAAAREKTASNDPNFNILEHLEI
ncbi:hypothetical protein TRFO_02894 [Tritrichomonas foetus]|uniref:Uncharacterized protein n=1 Tax=Tritrichomonas foetus TaxID=1144522 RepID=A0A1J4L0Z7_9EUKA|nr:hypothetical protein TRFO_02894 [Tritrichomonas foetus]|eukprot:OHT15549.1 hypothetical protein TRFO_02894 [Tritrichomonas foetus]